MITVFKQHLNLITEYNGIEGRKFYKIRNEIFFSSFCQILNIKQCHPVVQNYVHLYFWLCSSFLGDLSVRPS
jgi:hypothetical protein